MATSRWLIAIGLIVLIGMLVIGAFALGVYVGEHGWTRAGLQYQPGAQPPPGQMPPQGGNKPPKDQQPPGGAPDGLPPGRPQIIGRILKITPQSVNIATPDGPRYVILTPKTRYLEENGTPISPSALQRNDVVGVFGRLTQDGKRQFRADVIIKLPPPT